MSGPLTLAVRGPPCQGRDGEMSSLIRNVPVLTSIEMSLAMVFGAARQGCASGRWESGKPAFGFPLFHRPQLTKKPFIEADKIAVGAVGMWESRGVGEIPKGLWERVESLLLAFHRFHQPRHFHSAAVAVRPGNNSTGAVGPSVP